MLIMALVIKKIAVKSFMPKEGIEFTLSYNDGSDNRKMDVSMTLKNTEEEVDDLMIELRRSAKRPEVKFTGEKIIEGSTVVKIKDEDEVAKKIRGFLLKAKQKVDDVINSKSHEKYLNKINEIRAMSLEIK